MEDDENMVFSNDDDNLASCGIGMYSFLISVVINIYIHIFIYTYFFFKKNKKKKMKQKFLFSIVKHMKLIKHIRT